MQIKGSAMFDRPSYTIAFVLVVAMIVAAGLGGVAIGFTAGLAGASLWAQSASSGLWFMLLGVGIVYVGRLVVRYADWKWGAP